jgi:hypothetical protein
VVTEVVEEGVKRAMMKMLKMTVTIETDCPESHSNLK